MGANFSIPEELAGTALRHATSLGIPLSGLVAIALSAYLSANVGVAGSRRVADVGGTGNGPTADELSGRKAVMSASEWTHYRRELRRLRKITTAARTVY
jgi:hypothetical protein